ncbi:MAG: Arginyl-tRNA--protein transferase 1 [Alyxoria varia]|nr:MAG: Arginyl-tRNA--protein transferase 1 [Alyxoria varia]
MRILQRPRDKSEIPRFTWVGIEKLSSAPILNGASFYAISTSLSAEHYQLLMDRGWRREKKQDRNEFDLRKAVHASETEELPKEPSPEHEFTVEFDTDDFTEEKYALFEQYQRLVHKENPHEITRGGFKRFLCSSPIVRSFRTIKVPIPKSTQENDGSDMHPSWQKEIEQPLGSYHQVYRLDGKMVALAVLDLLPRGVSSVYLIYDVTYERFGFGKLSALREVQLTREYHYTNYYMGFYIPSCAKMRYKGEYKPQWVLDFPTMEWWPLEEMERRWEREKEEQNGSESRRKPPRGSPSVFELELEGILDEQTVDREMEFESGNLPVCIGNGEDATLALACDLRNWRDGRVRSSLTELVATTGLEVGREAVFQFNI